MRPKFLQFPNGERIRSDTITAIRLGDVVPADGSFAGSNEIPTRVIIDFGINHDNYIILNCKTDAERDRLAESIAKKIGTRVVPIEPSRVETWKDRLDSFFQGGMRRVRHLLGRGRTLYAWQVDCIKRAIQKGTAIKFGI